MIKIRYTPIKDLELSGNLAELHDLETSILKMLNSLGEEMVVDADNEFDPSPYEFRLSALRIKIRQGPVRVSVTPDKVLLIEGAEYPLEAFTSFLDILDGSFGNHSHYEYCPGEDKWIASDSLPLVLSVEE